MIQRFRFFVPALTPVLVMLLASPWTARAHDHRPPWLDEAVLDRGLYVAVQHPRVIRNPGPVGFTVALRNVAGERDVTVASITYSSDAAKMVDTHPVSRTLATQRTAYERYKATYAEMHDAAHRADTDRVWRLTRQCRDQLQQLAAGAVYDRYQVPAERVPSLAGSSLHMTVEIELIEDGGRRVISRTIDIPVEQPLPSGAESGRQWRYETHSHVLQPGGSTDALRGGESGAWYAGDQHLHTTYSLDALAIDGTTEDVTDYAAAAELLGLDWIIITDHSNVHAPWFGTDYYTPEQFAAGSAQAAAYTAQNPLLAFVRRGDGRGSDRLVLASVPLPGVSVLNRLHRLSREPIFGVALRPCALRAGTGDH